MLQVCLADAEPRPFTLVLSYIYTDRIHPTEEGTGCGKGRDEGGMGERREMGRGGGGMGERRETLKLQPASWLHLQ